MLKDLSLNQDEKKRPEITLANSDDPLLQSKRNPFCKHYRTCLGYAAQINLCDIDCSRCYFRDNREGEQETKIFLSSYLQLLRTIVRGNMWNGIASGHEKKHPYPMVR